MPKTMVVVGTILFCHSAISSSPCLTALSKASTLDLYLAIEDNDVEKVKTLLDSGVGVEWERYVETPLMQEIKQAPFGVSVTQNGASSSLLMDQRTPLIKLAIEKASIDIVKLIANHPETDVNQRFNGKMLMDNDTPLTLAIKRGRADVVRFLSNHSDIDINLSIGSWEDHGHTPLMIAAKKGNKEIIDILLENPKTDVNRVNAIANYDEWYDTTALGIAVDRGYEDIAFMISNHHKMDVRTLEQLMHHMVNGIHYREKALVRKLIKRKRPGNLLHRIGGILSRS